MEQCRLKKELPEWVCRDYRDVLCLGDMADCEAVDYSKKKKKNNSIHGQE